MRLRTYCGIYERRFGEGMHNNAVESYSFTFGDHETAQNNTFLYSLFESSKMNDIDLGVRSYRGYRFVAILMLKKTFLLKKRLSLSGDSDFYIIFAPTQQ